MLHKLKNIVKNTKVTRGIYSSLQSILVLFQYNFIKMYYLVKQNKTLKKIDKIENSDSLEVFYFGGDEFQDKSGFLQALDKQCNLTYFTKEDGSYGSYSFGVLNRKENIKRNQKRLIELLTQMSATPDLLLMQTWEWQIGVETLRKVRDLYPKIKIINIAMDDRHSYFIYGIKKYGSAGLIPELDYVLTTSSEAVKWYEKEGCCAYFYPLASDKNIFYPIPNIEKKYDVGFIGAKYGIRELIISELRKNGVNVKAYGNGWKDGRLPVEDTNLFYNQCELVLGVSTILGCKKLTSMKLRDFDVPMSGSVYITNYNADTASIFDANKEVVYFSDISDCVKKVKNLLGNQEKLKLIRIACVKKALIHTYDIRIKQIFNIIK